jgi:hypothetical protein
MIIANPIYDVVFKRLMENDRVAKFFIGTLLEQTIESIEIKPQEYTFIKDLDMDNPEIQKFVKEKIRDQLSINMYRLDFIATIKTENGEFKKVLIEIQKARNKVDLMRFRNYLAENYKKEDLVNQFKQVLPITTIYILGFKLPEIETACLKVERNYMDLIEQKIVHQKSEFVEKLTNDCYIVQVERITNRYQTKLDRLLSLFEQSNFLDDKRIIKEYKHDIENEEIRISIDILHHAVVDPKEKKLIEDEQEAWRSINAMFYEQEQSFSKIMESNRVELELNRVELELMNTEIMANKFEMESKDKMIDEKDKLIEELRNKITKVSELLKS